MVIGAVKNRLVFWRLVSYLGRQVYKVVFYFLGFPHVDRVYSRNLVHFRLTLEGFTIDLDLCH